jgi:hypothetical protein
MNMQLLLHISLLDSATATDVTCINIILISLTLSFFGL